MAAKRGARPSQRKPARPSSRGTSGGASRSGGARGGGARGNSRGGARKPSRDSAPTASRNVSRDKGLGGEQVEGRQAVRELLIARSRKIREVWISNDIDQSEIIDDIVELAHASNVQVLDVPRRKLEDQARSEAPQGVLAFAAPLREADFDQLISARDGNIPFLVAVDGVTDPGNLGALLRCCDGAGVNGVILPKHRAVHVTPTVAKTSAGAVEYVPMAVVSGLPNAITQMRSKGVWVVGLDDASDKTLFDLGNLASEPICMVLGAEGAGLSRLVRERCDMVVSIPMAGQVSSLNVSAAAALAVYEVARVRAHLGS
jgi:23S rRNA (guanosine2251-2'-O)-methyltransferase